ncbi:2-amino-4-hydroxy-6-hydroxymethyldihydropteridine diphosphokinase [Desulforamulus ferrireducens]|uniref:2-amino-4-hydroxy-6-hydroxymethyldihydropteridine diphosphokinase n=1 Tax=Desulforamulus ferrireducens TaxID=1833852 RepID=A0A1S6IT01_9FIRM|nr:2-amino-4-hydroxy-6-hydroxymethyldihydropteridine diphosphokinase [Desulforamulus ferrireducens]AQS57909.1 2-amino-4-hydroxy-6-hydroxymethyldihydropteridine diphosphokinase [Desulforamulus ferrireducens]
MTRAYIGLGSNLGNREENLCQALQRLTAHPGIQACRCASLYETAPWGNTQQDWFLNTVAEVETTLTPGELLQVLQEIEKALGRTRTVKWGPRTLDLDILLYGEEKIDLPDLQIPHPRLTERAFVLAPLAELQPDMTLPQGSIQDLLAQVLPEQEIRLYQR